MKALLNHFTVVCVMAVAAWCVMSTSTIAQETKSVEITAQPLDNVVDDPSDDTRARGTKMGLLFFIFVLAIFLGFELISKVPSQLHTPLMSGSNAISGITIVGALLAVGRAEGTMLTVLGTLAVIFAMINVVGGYYVTDRMLGMFKPRGPKEK